MNERFIIMNPKDNVATVLEEIPKQDTINIDDKEIVINRKIKFGHKFALKDIKKGKYIFKYGQIIGKAKKDINAGDWVHTRNVKSVYMERIKR